MTPRYSHHCLNSLGDNLLCTQRTRDHSSSLPVDPHRRCKGLRTNDLVQGIWLLFVAAAGPEEEGKRKVLDGSGNGILEIYQME